MAHSELMNRVVHCCLEVHHTLGPYLLEKVYSRALECELKLNGLSCSVEQWLSVPYKNIVIPDALRTDIIVEGKLIVELKAIRSGLTADHHKQLYTYMALSGIEQGLLVNFGADDLFDDGLYRVNNTRPLPFSPTRK